MAHGIVYGRGYMTHAWRIAWHCPWHMMHGMACGTGCMAHMVHTAHIMHGTGFMAHMVHTTHMMHGIWRRHGTHIAPPKWHMVQ